MPTAESVLRHAFQVGEFTVDPVTGQVRGPARSEQLEPKVMDVLVVLARRAGQVVPREELLQSVWPGSVVTDDALSRCIYQLRCHFRDAGGSNRYKGLVETLPKRGYRLRSPPAAPMRSPHPGYTWLAFAVAALSILFAASTWQLLRADYFWKDPLANARFSRFTDFDGIEEEAAISRDGSLVAFASDHDGAFDVWLSRVGGGAFRKLTGGGARELRNREVRTVIFSPDGTDVVYWIRYETPEGRRIELWAAPTSGASPHLFRRDVAELVWSSSGTRMAYHPPIEGDPIFVTEPGETVGRQIFAASPGLHCHFPVWSPDDAFIYFVYGRPPGEMDVWRVASTGGTPEQITFHNSRVGYPVLLDERTLLYLATAEDGSGPWLYGMNLERRVAHRIGTGLQPYASLSASSDGRQLVATVTTQRESLWRVPVLDRPAEPEDAQPIDVPGRGGRSPRLARDRLLYLAPTDGLEGLWRFSDGAARELWDGQRGQVVGGAAFEPNGQRVVFPVALGDRTELYLLDSDDGTLRPLAPELDVRGAPAWFPDGQWIAVAADRGSGPQLFKLPLDGGRPVPLVDEYSIDPGVSPDGSFLVYRTAEAGPSYTLKAVTADGEPYALPNLVLPRGSNRFVFVHTDSLPTGTALVVLKGELLRKNFWLVDLDTGAERQLTDFGPDFVIGDFDVSADGREIVFDRVREESDIMLIERGG